MKTTGLSSRIAAFSSPLASAGVDGTATQQARHVQVHRLEAVRVRRAELVAGALRHAHDQRHPRPGRRTCSGSCAAWLTIWSIASSEKLIVISSTTGRRPVIAAPTPIADDRVLGDRRVAHALLAELLEQPLR